MVQFTIQAALGRQFRYKSSETLLKRLAAATNRATVTVTATTDENGTPNEITGCATAEEVHKLGLEALI